MKQKIVSALFVLFSVSLTHAASFTAHLACYNPDSQSMQFEVIKSSVVGGAPSVQSNQLLALEVAKTKVIQTMLPPSQALICSEYAFELSTSGVTMGKLTGRIFELPLPSVTVTLSTAPAKQVR